MPTNEDFGIPADLPTEAGATYKTLPPASQGAPPPASGDYPSISFATKEADRGPSDSGAEDVTAAPEGAPPAAEPDATGEMLGEFHLVRVIGRGGMGEVWEAYQSSLMRVVAVKRVRGLGQRTRGEGESLLRAFRDEAVIAGRLQHPNIAPVHDLAHDRDGSPLLAMKLIEGEAWSAAISRDWGTLDAESFLSRHLPILVSVAQAVAFAHSRGIVHRDLKPSQVMIGSYGEVLLTDWGLAVQVGGGDPSSKLAAASGLPDATLPGPSSASAPGGTPAFMSPEQTLRSARHVGTWTDVFLLGGCLYMLLAGVPPNSGKSAAEVFMNAHEANIPSPRERVGESRLVPPELEALCMECLRREPADRLAGASEFVLRLQDYLSGAGKRRESATLTASVLATLQGGTPGYAAFGSAIESLGRAWALWPDNPALPTLRERAHAGYAEAALVNGDLAMARLQAESLDRASTLRVPLLLRVDAAAARIEQQRRQRRIAVVAAVAMLGILLVSSTFFSMGIARQRDIAIQRESEAAVARRDSEELVQFVVGDLRDRLGELGRVDLLDAAARKAWEYYSRQDLAQLDDAGRKRVILGLSNVAAVYEAQGNRDDAVRTLDFLQATVAKRLASPDREDDIAYLESYAVGLKLRQARTERTTGSPAESARIGAEALESALKSFREGRITAQEVAMLIERISTTAREAGDDAESSRLLLKAMEVMEETKLPIRPGEGSGDIAASVSSHRGVLAFRRGDYKEAERLLAEGVRLWRANVSANPNDKNAIGLTNTMVTQAQLLARTGRDAEAVGILDVALPLQRQLHAGRKLEAVRSLNLVGCLRAYSEIRRQQGRDAEALTLIEEAAEVLEEAMKVEEGNLRVMESFVTTQASLAESLVRNGREADALGHSGKALATARRLKDAQPTHIRGYQLIQNAAAHHANVLQGLGRHAEAAEAIRESMAAADEMIRLQPTVGEYVNLKVELYGFLGRSLAAIGDPEAEAVYREGHRLIGERISASPRNRRMVSYRNSLRGEFMSLLADRGRYEEASALGDAALKEAREGIASAQDKTQAFGALSKAALNQTGVLLLMGDEAGAKAVIEQALAEGEKVAPPPSDALVPLRARWLRIAAQQGSRGTGTADFLALTDRAVRPIIDALPAEQSRRGTLADLQIQAATALQELGDLDGALARADVATSIARVLPTRPQDDPARRATLATALATRSRILALQGEEAGAAIGFAEADTHLAELSKSTTGLAQRALADRIRLSRDVPRLLPRKAADRLEPTLGIGFVRDVLRREDLLSETRQLVLEGPVVTWARFYRGTPQADELGALMPKTPGYSPAELDGMASLKRQRADEVRRLARLRLAVLNEAPPSDAVTTETRAILAATAGEPLPDGALLDRIDAWLRLGDASAAAREWQQRQSRSGPPPVAALRELAQRQGWPAQP